MALTRVAPAGIGSTPGTGYVIGDSFLHATGLNATNAYYTGIVTAQTFRVIGDFQVDGTTTTLDTVLTEVDKLEVGANNNTVGVAITQSGSGDILRLYDSTTQAVTVKDGGNFGIGSPNPDKKLVVLGADSEVVVDDTNGTPVLRLRNNGSTGGTMELSSSNDLLFRAGGASEKLRVTSGGSVGIGTVSPGVQSLEIW